MLRGTGSSAALNCQRVKAGFKNGSAFVFDTRYSSLFKTG
jgi:hypothetical protein